MPSKKLMCWINNLEQQKPCQKKPCCLYLDKSFSLRGNQHFTFYSTKDSTMEKCVPSHIHTRRRKAKKERTESNDNSSSSNSKKANNSKDYILFGFIYLISSACFYASTECHWFNVGLIVFWQCAVSITFYYPFRVLKNRKTKQKDTAKFSSYHTRTDEHKTMHGRSSQTTTQRIFRLLLSIG